MINGIGIDLVEVGRIDQMLKKWQQKFTTKLFTLKEIKHCCEKVNQAECFAARFAAKEALAKALGHGWCVHFRWTDVEVSNEKSGRPIFIIKGVTEKLVKGKRVLLSLTHTKLYASAIVTVESV